MVGETTAVGDHKTGGMVQPAGSLSRGSRGESRDFRQPKPIPTPPGPITINDWSVSRCHPSTDAPVSGREGLVGQRAFAEWDVEGEELAQAPRNRKAGWVLNRLFFRAGAGREKPIPSAEFFWLDLRPFIPTPFALTVVSPVFDGGSIVRGESCFFFCTPRRTCASELRAVSHGRHCRGGVPFLKSDAILRSGCQSRLFSPISHPDLTRLGEFDLHRSRRAFVFLFSLVNTVATAGVGASLLISSPLDRTSYNPRSSFCLLEAFARPNTQTFPTNLFQTRPLQQWPLPLWTISTSVAGSTGSPSSTPPTSPSATCAGRPLSARLAPRRTPLRPSTSSAMLG